MNSLFLKYVKNHRQVALFFGLVLISLVYTLLHFSHKEQSKEIDSFAFQISDMIPSHFVMVPIELENHEAIRGLIPSHGVVDLYQNIPFSLKPHKIAQAVQIVRSSSDQFNVLIPENKVAPFVQSENLFHAVVQNSDKKDTQIYPIPVRRKRSIQFEEEEP